MAISKKNFAIQLSLKDYKFVVNGEHKSLLKFYIHPNSVHEERWISRISKAEEPRVYNIIRKPFTGRTKFIQFEKEMLLTVSHTILLDMLSVVPIRDHNQLAEGIIFLTREGIAEKARNFRNKAVLIAVKIKVITVKLSEELMKELEENERRNYNGSIPESYSWSVANLEKVKLVENSGKKCVICFKEILAGSTMIRTECSHEFHAECIIEWFSRINLCPRCRFEMPTCIFDRFLCEY